MQETGSSGANVQRLDVETKAKILEVNSMAGKNQGSVRSPLCTRWEVNWREAWGVRNGGKAWGWSCGTVALQLGPHGWLGGPPRERTL